MSEDLINELNAPVAEKSLITIVGVGGAGGNAVNYMHSMGIEGVTFMVCNTDSQALQKSPVELKVQLGPDGLGAGNDPERGRDAANWSLEDVRRRLETMGTEMIFIAAGMGGGTGTGASPVIAKLAHEMGILTVAIVTLPFVVEGLTRYEQASKGIEELREWVDSLLVLNNNNLVELYGRMSLRQAFDKANDVLALAAKGLAEIITVPSDLVNVDFSDVKRVLLNSGRAHMSVASATGENRAEEAVEASLKSPLLDSQQIKGAKNILLNISVASADSLSLEEAHRVVSCVQEHASMRKDKPTANIIWGSGSKPSLGDALEVVIIATGFELQENGSDDIETMIKNETEKLASNDAAAGRKGDKKPPLSNDQRDHVIPSRSSDKYKDVDAMLQLPAYMRRKMLFDNDKHAPMRRDARDAADKEQPQNDTTLF